MSESVAQRAGRYLADLVTETLPAEVVDKAASCLVDAMVLGAVAGSEHTTRAALATAFQAPEGSETARLWSSAGHAPLNDAVLVNSFSVHALFHDDCDMSSWSHPGSLVVPAVVAAGEIGGTSVSSVLRGIVAGYGLMNWIGSDGDIGHRMVMGGFRTSPTIGPLGSAAGTAVVFGLGADKAAHAIAMAAASAGGVIDTVRAGSEDWRLQNATAALRGSVAARLAAGGVQGSLRIFESDSGYLASFTHTRPAPVPAGEPRLGAILDSWSKPYPTLGDNVAVVSAAESLRGPEGLAAADVVAVRVHQNAEFASYPGTAFRGPYTSVPQAIASTAYAVASTLAHGTLHYDRYPDRLDDPEILAVVERLTVVPEPDFGYLDGVVEVETVDGRSRRCDAADLPRTLFHRDRTSTASAAESMLRHAGRAEGTGTAFAQTVFDAVDQDPERPVREITALLEGLR